MENIEKIGKKFYREVDESELTKKLDSLLAQKASINYDALKEEYQQNVAAMKDYEKSIDAQIELPIALLSIDITKSSITQSNLLYYLS